MDAESSAGAGLSVRSQRHGSLCEGQTGDELPCSPRGCVRVNDARRSGRIVVRADDPSLTGHGDLAVIGDLESRLGLIVEIDGELGRERRARPVKVRRRGVSPGELVLARAECQLVGGAFFDHLQDQRADEAGARLRRSRECPLRRWRCSCQSAFAGCTASASSGRWLTRASGLTGRSVVTSPSR